LEVSKKDEKKNKVKKLAGRGGEGRGRGEIVDKN